MKKKQYQGPADRLLLGTVLLLIIWGLVALSSASAVISYERFGHNNYYFFRQIIFAGLGIIVLFLVSRIDYHFWKRWSQPLMLFGILALIVVLIPAVGFRPTTARSWFRLGDFLLQPAELVKLFVIFYLASWFERKKEAETNFWFGVLPPLLVAGFTIGLVVLQPDIGSAVVIAAIVATVFFVSGVRLQYLASLLFAAIVGLWILIKTVPYRAARIVTFLDPSFDPRGIGYHINQALLAIGAGGLWGYGFGASRQKHNYLPEPIGDSIFAIMAEELGFLRIILLIILFAITIAIGLRIAKRAPDKFGYLVASGITSWIGLQAIINISAISGLLPLTGIPLPFISYGGSSLLALCTAVGVLLNISRQRI